MRFRLRTLMPGQFGLLALFIVLTVAAVALAVVRLDLSPAVKFGPLAAILMGFCFWMARSVRNR